MWTTPGSPCGQKRRYTLGYQQWVRTPMGKCRTPVRTDRTSEYGPEPPRACLDPLCRVQTTHSKVPGQNMHRPWTGPRRGSNDDTCPDPVWCGPVRLRHCSPPGQRPDAATWPTARDVSWRAEPDVRPPGYAAPAFIADKARRLSVPLTGDVPPRHLMSPAIPLARMCRLGI
jgi:hypothetical protein